MPVQFIVGRAGAGKTFRILETVAQLCRDQPLGRPIWLIVPRQATFEYERALLARLGAFTRARVVSMETLGEEVLAEVGGAAITHVSAAGRRMIIGRLLWRHHDELRYFASSARRPGLAAAVDELFDDFERSGQSLDRLDEVIASFGRSTGTPSLQAKLADLRLLYEKYHAFIGQDRLDPDKRRQEITRRLRRAGSLAHSRVFVDAFYEFTANERQILAEVASVAERMEIALTLPAESPVIGNPRLLPDELSVFHRTEVSYQRLHRAMQEAGVTIDAPVKLTETRRFVSDDLSRIEQQLATGTMAAEATRPLSDTSVVDFIEAPDTRTEVQRVAACVNDLLRTEGLRRRDILVLVRSLPDYLHLIHAAFSEHGIAYFADRRRPASHHPLIRFVRAAVWIARDRWSPEAVIALGKTQLAGLSPPEADRLENRIREYGITATAWLGERSLRYRRPEIAADEEFGPAAAPPPESAGENSSSADGNVVAPEPTLPPTGRELNDLRTHLQERLNPLLELLGRSAGPDTVRRFAIGIMNAIEAFGVRQTLAGWIAAETERDPELADEHTQVWSQLQGLLQELVDVLGDEEMHPAEFVEVLETGLDGFDLAIPPATLDQVLVGTVDRTRSIAPKAVFVLGLSRGMFPATHRDDSLLSGVERRELHRRQIEIDSDPARRQLDERFLGYLALTRASHRLIVSRPQAAVGGARLDASEFWDSLRRLLPHAPLEQCETSPLQQLSTPRALIGTVLDWARHQIDAGHDAAHSSAPATDWRRSLYDWLASGDTGPAVERVATLAWPSLSYSNHPQLDEAVTRALFAPPLVFSAAQLESFASCPFQHFAGYGLKLSTRQTSAVSAMELSLICHEVLQRIVDAALARKENLTDYPAVQIQWLLRNWVQPIARQLHGGRFLAEPRGQYLVARIERMLAMVLASTVEQLRRGAFKPLRAGVPFGREDAKLKSPSVRLADGSTVKLKGSIDRIDATPDQSLAIYDYRMSEQKFSAASVYHGLSLRLVASMLVMDRAAVAMKGKTMRPVAGLTSRLRRSLQDKEHPGDADDPESPEFLLQAKPRGVIRATHARAIDKETTTGQSPVAAFQYNKDGSFGNREKSDVLDPDDFDQVLAFTERKIAELASGVVGGTIDVAPYWFEDRSPCPQCEFRSVCRFETPTNRYRKLESMKRAEALDAMKRS